MDWFTLTGWFAFVAALAGWWWTLRCWDKSVAGWKRLCSSWRDLCVKKDEDWKLTCNQLLGARLGPVTPKETPRC